MTTLEAILLVIAIILVIILMFYVFVIIKTALFVKNIIVVKKQLGLILSSIILIGTETKRNLEEIMAASKDLGDYIIKKGERK